MVGSRTAAWFSLFVIASLVLVALSPLPFAGDLEQRAGALVTPLTDAMREAARPAADVALRAGQIRELSAENAALRHRVATLEAEAAAMREQQLSTEQAAALLRSVGGDAGSYLHAPVLLHDPAPGRALLLIGRGERDGVAVGQPVLGAGSTLVGVVVSVEARSARVRVLTDRDSSVAAVVQSSRTPGSLAGIGGGLRLEFVPNGAAVSTGDVVLTSPLGGLLPGGLLVGRVTAVRAAEQDLFETIEVEPLADFRRLEQVLVMTGFAPDTLLGRETAR